MKTLSFFFASLMAVGWVFAQPPQYVRNGSIGKSEVSNTRSGWHQYHYLPMDEWVGKRVIFMPQPRGLREFGYQDFEGGSGQLGQPTYEEAAGKIGTVISIVKGEFPKVTIRMEAGKEYVGTVYNGTLSGITFLDEIDLARKEFIGKTLWVKSDKLDTYDETSGTFGSLKVPKYSPVKVTDVVVGWEDEAPVQFILRTSDDKQGFVDVNLSGTNISSTLAKIHQFDKKFYMVDPRTLFPWSSHVWIAIENEKVFVGMTKSQVRMSWGEPASINRTLTGEGKTEQWVYSESRYVYFTNGVMTGAQN